MQERLKQSLHSVAEWALVEQAREEGRREILREIWELGDDGDAYCSYCGHYRTLAHGPDGHDESTIEGMAKNHEASCLYRRAFEAQVAK